jgi:FkbM family methyltransferase
MKLHPGDVISESIAFTGIYDLPLTRRLRGLALKGGRLVDVGANLGYFSLLWAATHPTNTVIAFEASTRNIERLSENIQKNHLENRVEVQFEAVGRENGEMHFDPGPKEQTGWGKLCIAPTNQSQSVRVVRLDDALANVDKIDFLKIDIEGADTWAILGAERLFREHRIKHVCWEEHGACMAALNIPKQQATNFLRDCGYVVSPLGHPDAECVEWYASC